MSYFLTKCCEFCFIDFDPSDDVIYFIKVDNGMGRCCFSCKVNYDIAGIAANNTKIITWLKENKVFLQQLIDNNQPERLSEKTSKEEATV